MSAADGGRWSVDLVASNLAQVRGRITAAGGDPAAVEVVAVTKGLGADAVLGALGAGLRSIGENYAGELLSKVQQLPRDASETAHWHFIGSIQRRTVGRLAGLVTCWQSVWRLEEGETITRHAPGANVLVEVNLAGADNRPGVPIAELSSTVGALARLGLDVRGVMGVGPPGPAEKARPGFRELAARAADLGLATVSMGMSDDLEVAVAEGSTMVRVGRALFGDRPVRER